MTVRRQPRTAPRAGPTTIGPTPAESLGDNLRALFDHVAEQPLPDEIMGLVDELERKRLIEDPDED